jgi:arylsulfatase A-like enzyme
MTMSIFSRRDWRSLTRAMVAVALLGALAWGGLGAAEAQARPNVVVVMTDDQDAASLRVMSAVKQQIGRAGATFRNFFATFPLCCPSRVSFLTGQYAHNHRVMGNKPPRGGFAAYNDAGSLPIALDRAGYRTAYIGKYLNGYGAPGTRVRQVPRGWDRWHVPVNNTFFRMYDYTLNENGTLQRYGSAPRDYQTDVFANKTVQFIRQNAGGQTPFFVTLSTLAPHKEGNSGDRDEIDPNPRPAPRHEGRFEDAPLPKPPSFNEADVSDKPSFVRSRPRLSRDKVRALRETHQARLGSLLAVDDAVQRIVGTLKREGELRNTLIAFTSDNGYLLGVHRLRAKEFLYEESVKVPMLLRGPGIPRGVSRSQVTGNIDLAPTILDAANVAPLRTMDGRSLLPLARGGGAGGRDILFENAQSTGVRTGRHVYIEHETGEVELYDLRTDPYQLRSQHRNPSYASIRGQLAAGLAQLRDCAGASCR